MRGEYIVAAPLTDICGTMDSTVQHSDANLPNALLHHIVRLSETHCFFRPLLCYVVFHPYVSVVLCSTLHILLERVCCVVVFCLYYVPLVSPPAAGR